MLLGHIEKVSSHVSKRLREERENKGLSMTTLASRAGLSQAMISFVERDIRNPSLDTLLRITHVLNVDLWCVIRDAELAVRKGDKNR